MKFPSWVPEDKRFLAGIAAVGGAFYIITWGIENGFLRNEIANKNYVDAADTAVVQQLQEEQMLVQKAQASQLNVIESQGVERQLTNLAKARCTIPVGENRYDEIWNSLRTRFTKLRPGETYVFAECAK